VIDAQKKICDYSDRRTHHNTEKENQQERTHLKPSPQEGERPLGCSGRTTLRREQCYVLPGKRAY
jgi:hypothetical protein